MDEEYLPVRIKPPPRAEVLFAMARGKSFPLCILELEEKKEGITNPVVKVQVNSKVYKVLKDFFKSDRALLYCSLNDDNSQATIGTFTD